MIALLSFFSLLTCFQSLHSCFLLCNKDLNFYHMIAPWIITRAIISLQHSAWQISSTVEAEAEYHYATNMKAGRSST